MSRRLITAVTVVLAFAAAASLVAAGITMASRRTRVNFDFTPSTVPRHTYAAGAIHVHLRTAVPHRTRASRIRFDFDSLQVRSQRLPNLRPLRERPRPDRDRHGRGDGPVRIGQGRK